MVLKSAQIYARLTGRSEDHDPSDPLSIIPYFEIESLRNSGAASVDLRLGRWFLLLRSDRTPLFEVKEEAKEKKGTKEGEESNSRKNYSKLPARQVYVPFGETFYVQPGAFVLAATLEWVRLPADLAGTITGKSSWGRRGLVIETAAAIHPGFAGCLALEISNLGGVPIELRPGMTICQISFLRASDKHATESSFDGMRRPEIGSITMDEVARRLGRAI